MPKLRQVNEPGNGVGKKRQALYAIGTKRIEMALKRGFALEAITLCESMMSDRLESRKAWKSQQLNDYRRFTTLGKLARQLCSDHSEPAHARDIYIEVKAWADKRNSALHEMFKLAEGDGRSWRKRYQEAREIAREGIKLARKVSNLVRSLNRPARP